jgi:predicted AlkP superfamily pyrophosphatase or phosphodiesterase
VGATNANARDLVVPDYSGRCVCNVAPALLDDPDHLPSWFPASASGADRIVMLVVDGLGWEQLQDRRHIATSMSDMDATAITTVAPTTTATALTSLATGVPPGEHGVMGYRIAVGRDILNVLRWTTSRGDARDSIDPRGIGLVEPFGSQRPPVVNKAEVEFSGFTEAHLRGTRHVGYRMPSTLNAEVVRLVRSGEPFVYAYYDGIDKVAHEYGLGEHYAAELQAIDMMIGALAEALPRDAALVVTADHGQVDVGDHMIRPHPEVLAATDFQSGEGRFRWFHAHPGARSELLEAATHHHGDVAWVMSREQIVSDGWFGPKVVPEAMARLGDVALVARDDVAFEDPADTGPFDLISRHGSMTSAEVLVPLLVARG